MKIIVNPVYQKLVPPVTESEYKSLKESIKSNGLWLPIITNNQGVILDGHNRFKACQELGVQMRLAVREFDSELWERKFVIETNLKRRQLNDFQKAELGVLLLPIEQELAKQRQDHDESLGSNDPKGRARDIAANKMGMSATTFERAKKVIEDAPEDVKQKLREGNPHTSISKEYQKLKKNEKREIRQNEIKNLQVKLPSTVTLYNQEFQTAPVAPNSVSLIMTDPPYHEKYLHLYDDLGEHAAKVLRDGGSLITYAGHYAIGTIINKMEAHGLKFHWPIAVIHSGPSASVFGRKILVGYKPMLWFVKGKYEGEFVRDVIQSEFQGKELHEWAQSTKESDYYIKYLTIENEIVYDPFMGQGTFGISAVRQNRQFIGCEVDPDHFANAERMISHGN
jgi:ParB-like chromosome segregation protein Spo0J